MLFSVEKVQMLWALPVVLASVDELPAVDLRFTPPLKGDKPQLKDLIRMIDSSRESYEEKFATTLTNTFESWRGKIVELVQSLLRTRTHASFLEMIPPPFLGEPPQQQVRVRLVPAEPFPEEAVIPGITSLETKRIRADARFMKQGIAEFGRVYSMYAKELKAQILKPCSPSLVQINEHPSKISPALNLRLSLAPGFTSVASMVDAMEDRRDIVEDNQRQAVVKLTGDMLQAGNDKIREMLRLDSSLLQIPLLPELSRTIRSRMLAKTDVQVDFKPPGEDVGSVKRDIMAINKLEKDVESRMNKDYLREKSAVVSRKISEMKRLICTGLGR